MLNPGDSAGPYVLVIGAEGSAAFSAATRYGSTISAEIATPSRQRAVRILSFAMAWPSCKPHLPYKRAERGPWLAVEDARKRDRPES